MTTFDPSFNLPLPSYSGYGSGDFSGLSAYGMAPMGQGASSGLFQNNGFGNIEMQSGDMNFGAYRQPIEQPDNGLFSNLFNGGAGKFMKEWGTPLLGAAQGINGLFMGMKQYGLQKDLLEQKKKEFQMNYDAQRRTTNASMEDRQRARLAANNNHEGVDSYMDRYGIK